MRLPILLYSTNVFMKYHIQNRYAGGSHYVWCSENFDSRAVSTTLSSSRLPPSSNPAELYRNIKSDIERGDGHSAKIQEQRVSILARATQWQKDKAITDEQLEDIT